MPTATLARDLVDALRRRGWKLAVAESMTGGLVGGAVTTVAGSSEAFLGGILCYTDDAKTEHLGVDRTLLAQKGAVHGDVAKAMATGVLQRFGADVAVSVTGHAGPDAPRGGEVGLVRFGLATKGRVASKEMHFGGDREAIRRQAVDEALALVLSAVKAP